MSNLASTSRTQMRYQPEVTFGVIPTVGTPRKLRMTGESLDMTLSKETSKEIRDDRQLTGATTVNANASGDINFEMSYAEYDPLFEALFMGTWGAYGVNGVGTAFAAAYTVTTITAGVAPTGADAFTNLKLGQWFRVVHAGSINNGKLFRVSTSVAPTTTDITLDASTPALVEASSAGASVYSSRLTNGVTERSFTFEKNFSDVAQFFAYRGQYVSKMMLKFASAALLDGSFSLMGKDAIRGAATALTGGAAAASKTYNIQNAVRGVGVVWEGGVPMTGAFLKSLDLTVDNNLRVQDAIGNLGAVGIGVGDFSATGSFSMYFANGSMYDKFLADVYTSITFSNQDADGNGYVWTLPRVQIMTGKVVAGGKNADVMGEFTFTAFSDDLNADASLRKTLILDRIGAAVVP